MSFMLLLVSTGIYSVPFAGITDTAQTAYGQNFSSINNTFTTYLLASLVLGLPSNYIILKIGVHWSLTICSLLILSGTVVRLLANSYSFSWMFVGQFISGCAPPLVQNGIFFYCHKIFSKSQAPIMLALMSLMNPLGTMIGFVLPYIFVDNNQTDPGTLKDQFYQYLVMESFLAGGVMLLVALFVRNGGSSNHHHHPSKAPQTGTQSLQQNPQSLLSEQSQLREYSMSDFRNLIPADQANTQINPVAVAGTDNPTEDDVAASTKVPVMTQYKILFQDSAYIVMMCGGSCIFGLLGAFGGAIVQEVVIWNMSENLGSILAAICVLVGLISSVAYAVLYIEKPGQLRNFMVFQVICFVGCGVCVLGLITDLPGVLVGGTLLYAVFTFPSFPIMMEQIGKRVGKELELVATGNVFFLTQLVTAGLLFGVGALLDMNTKAASLISFAAYSTVILVTLLFGIGAFKKSNSIFASKIKN